MGPMSVSEIVAMTSHRTIDASLPAALAFAATAAHTHDDESLFNQISNVDLPLPYEIIPPHVHNLTQCALHQIHTLSTAPTTSTSTSSNDEKQEEAAAEAIADALDDGFVLCDLPIPLRKLRAFRTLFPRIKPFFALKCHPDRMVSAVLGKSYGGKECGYDCASLSEIRLALDSMGGNKDIPGDPKRCIYANPQRAERDLDEALELGVECLVFDGVEELRKIKEAYQKRLRRWEEKKDEKKGEKPQPPELVLRILVPDSTSAVPLGEKFGANPINVEYLTEQACELHLPVIGVSFHCGSGCHDPEADGTALKLAKVAVDTISNVLSRQEGGKDARRCTLVDIGGGYPGLDGCGGDIGRFSGACTSSGNADTIDVADDNEGDNQETASKIAEVVTPLVDELFPPNNDTLSNPVQLIAEPGRYFVESAFALCMRIYSTRTEHVPATASKEAVGGEGVGVDDAPRIVQHYYIAQGVWGVFKDVLLCGETFDPIPLQANKMPENDDEEDDSSPEEASLFPSVVHGPSGEDFDIVCASYLLPEMSVGDWLIFDRMGAYTMSIAARSGSLPIRYVAGGRG